LPIGYIMYSEMTDKRIVKFTKIPARLLKRSDPILTIKVWANGMYYAEHDNLDEAIPRMAAPAVMNTSLLLEMLAEMCAEFAKAKKLIDRDDVSIALAEAKGIH